MKKTKLVSFSNDEYSEAFSLTTDVDGTVTCSAGTSVEKAKVSSSKAVNLSLEDVWACLTDEPFPKNSEEVLHLTSRRGVLKHLNAVIHHDLIVMMDRGLLTKSKLKKLTQKYLSHRNSLVNLIREFDSIEQIEED